MLQWIALKGALFLARFSTVSKVSNFLWENVCSVTAVVVAVAAADASFQYFYFPDTLLSLVSSTCISFLTFEKDWKGWHAWIYFSD